MLTWVVQQKLLDEYRVAMGETAEKAISRFKQEWGLSNLSFNLYVKNKTITIHELKKPIGPKKFKELRQPKKRCLNPPTESTTQQWLNATEELT